MINLSFELNEKFNLILHLQNGMGTGRTRQVRTERRTERDSLISGLDKTEMRLLRQYSVLRTGAVLRCCL